MHLDAVQQICDMSQISDLTSVTASQAVSGQLFSKHITTMGLGAQPLLGTFQHVTQYKLAAYDSRYLNAHALNDSLAVLSSHQTVPYSKYL